MVGRGAVLVRSERATRRSTHRCPLADPPPISVLIPCFNEEENAEETITHALALDYPEFEVIAINDGSRDGTAAVLERLAALHPRLRVIHLAENQGKAMALRTGALLARHEILVCIDGDALLDRHAAHWLVRHFVAECRAWPRSPATRASATARRSWGACRWASSPRIVGIIKRAQKTFGRIFTVSGVITAFRRSAVHQVDYWSTDILTEDIDITWKLYRAGWDVRFEPRALVLDPRCPRPCAACGSSGSAGPRAARRCCSRTSTCLSIRAERLMWPLLLEMCAASCGPT